MLRLRPRIRSAVAVLVVGKPAHGVQEIEDFLRTELVFFAPSVARPACRDGRGVSGPGATLMAVAQCA